MHLPKLLFYPAAAVTLALPASAAIVINPGESYTVVFDNLQETFNGPGFLPSSRIFLNPFFSPGGVEDLTARPFALIYEDSLSDTPAQSDLIGANAYFTFPNTMLQDGDGILIITARAVPVTVESLTVVVPFPFGPRGHVLTQTVTVPEPSTGMLLATAGLCILGRRTRRTAS